MHQCVLGVEEEESHVCLLPVVDLDGTKCGFPIRSIFIQVPEGEELMSTPETIPLQHYLIPVEIRKGRNASKCLCKDRKGYYCQYYEGFAIG